MRFLYFYLFTDVISAMRVTEVSAEYWRKYTSLCVQDNADVDRLLRLIGEHYLARYREVDGMSRSDRDYIRTWPWKIVCHKFAVWTPRLWSTRYMRINQGGPAGSLWRKNSIKQTNVLSDKCSKRLIYRWAYK